jgi:hypothetical protein
MVVMLNRNDYWQCAYVIPKGTTDEVKHAGRDNFRNSVGDISPFLRDRLHEMVLETDAMAAAAAHSRAAARVWRAPGAHPCVIERPTFGTGRSLLAF